MEEAGLVGQPVVMCDDNNNFIVQVVVGYHSSHFDGLGDEVSVCNVDISLST